MHLSVRVRSKGRAILSRGNRVEDGKACPQCAETVKVNARVCRFCGWNFEKQNAQPPAASKNSFQSCLGCVGMCIVALVILAAVGSVMR